MSLCDRRYHYLCLSDVETGMEMLASPKAHLVNARAVYQTLNLPEFPALPYTRMAAN